MRIGIATHNYPPHPGGLETIVQELTRGFAREHEVVVVSTAWEGCRGVTSDDGATVHRLPAWHGPERRGVPYATPLGPGMRRAWAELRVCDIVHAHGSLYATTILAVLARRRGVPLFVTEHVGFVHYPSRSLNVIQRMAWLTIGRPVVHCSTAVVAYNSRVHEWLAESFGKEKVLFIRNGVDTSTFHPRSAAERLSARSRLGLPAKAVIALFVGREALKKNLEKVLSFPQENYRLAVCGAHRDLPQDILDIGLVPHVEMPEVFAAADFLVHAATGEGFPVAIQEAMASGLPVVLLWDPGYSGSVDREVVIAADTLDSLARAASEVAASAEVRRQVGDASREYALAHWSWDTTVARHLEAFRTAIKEDL